MSGQPAEWIAPALPGQWERINELFNDSPAGARYRWQKHLEAVARYQADKR